MATYQIIDLQTGTFSTGTLDEAAEISSLDPHDIEWAIEEHGLCETDTFQITKLVDPPEDGHSKPEGEVGDQPGGGSSDDGDGHSPADGGGDPLEGDAGDGGDADSQVLTPVFVYISKEEFEAHLAEHPAAVIRLKWDEPMVRSVVEAQREKVMAQLRGDESGEGDKESSAVYHLTREAIALIR
jgi:hypothetical protein